VSNTTTAPYFGLLGAVTAVLVLTAQAPGLEGGVYIGLWRFAMIAFGAAIGTAAQLFLWPDDPEDQLLRELGERLAFVEGLRGAGRAGARWPRGWTPWCCGGCPARSICSPTPSPASRRCDCVTPSRSR